MRLLVFPGEDQYVKFFESLDEHRHVELDLPEFQKFSWKRNVEAENIVTKATKHNVVASNIMEELETKGINPLPSISQLWTRMQRNILQILVN